MKANNFFLRTAGLVAGTMLLTAGAVAAEADAIPTFQNNYLKLAVGGAAIDGSEAAYQARTQNYKAGAIGIEELRFEYDLGNDTTLQLDGRALAGQEDYLLSFRVTKEEVGSVEFGFKTFRTFYDGAGGFFPIGNTWLPLFPREQYIDRGQFFVNATIAKPNAPVFTFKYTNSTRDGTKDSTIWGDTNLTGIPIWAGPGASNPFSAARKLLPAMTDIDERTQHWEIGVSHKMGNTTGTVAVGSHLIDINDTRYMLQNIGELNRYPTVAFTQLTMNNAHVGLPRRTYMTHEQEETSFYATAEIETVLSEKATLFAGLSFHTADIDIGADRQLIATFLTGAGVKEYIGGFNNTGSNARAPYNFTSSGTMEQEVITGNIGARLQPNPTLSVEVALRGERYEDSGSNLANYTSQGATLSTGAFTQFASQGLHQVQNVEKPWTPTIDVRYTGIRNVALYGSWEYRTAKQDEFVHYNGLNGLTKQNELDLLGKDIEENHSNLVVGANWTATRAVSVRAEVFSKDHENQFNGYEDVLGRNYTLNYDIYGAKLSVVVKPMQTVTSTSRYILQRGKAAIFHSGLTTTGVINGTVDGNDSHRHTFAETVTWNPNKNMYVQANGTVVFDQIKTMYPWVTGVAKQNLRNSDSNYRTADVTVGFALDKATDGRFQVAYYRADNFDIPYAQFGMPYGASARDLSVTFGVRRKLSANSVLGAKLGYIDSENATRGDFADFKGPVGYLTFERAF